MAFYEITFSPTGGTKKAADFLKTGLSKITELIDLCDRETDFAEYPFTSGDFALIAVPSYGGRVPALAAERLKKLNGNGAKAVLLCVYGNRAYDNTLAELQEAARQAGFRDIAAVAAVAEHSIIRQVAAGRPDEADAKTLQDMAAQILEKLNTGSDSEPQVPGKVPEKQGMSAGMAPKTSDACTKCGLCAEKCPAGAIDSETMASDSKKCIGCMRCIAICPAGAKSLNKAVTGLGGPVLSKLWKTRKECELFL